MTEKPYPEVERENLQAAEIIRALDEGQDAKVFSIPAALRMFEKPVERTIEELTYEPVFSFPLLTEWTCDKLIEASLTANKWASEEGDNYPGDEVRLHQISPKLERYFAVAFCAAANSYLAERYAKYRIAPNTITGAFIIRYRAGVGVQELGVHHDGMSAMTFSIPLNSGYTGSGLFFATAPELGPEGWQGEPGECLCFPGGPTHEHYVKPIESGERYSLTIWTEGV